MQKYEITTCDGDLIAIPPKGRLAPIEQLVEGHCIYFCDDVDAEIARLQADKERLDWLDHNRLPTTNEYRPDIRSAIDAARKED